jgi:hypothetical protein
MEGQGMKRTLTTDEQDYLRGWGAAAVHTNRSLDSGCRDLSRTGGDWIAAAIKHIVPVVPGAWSAGWCDAMLAAVGHGDADGATLARHLR